MDERGQQWREKREEDRTRDEVLEDRWVDEEHDEHRNFLTKEKNFISLNNMCFFLTIVPFKGEEDRGV